MGTMNTNRHTFPFGQPVKPVIQKDRSPKKVFVLGVYASAVHAKWVGADNKTKIMALAVASEPYIFWRGDKAEEIIANINIPPALGKLVPAAKNLNGPSGNAYQVLPLVHPRQAGRLGAHLEMWAKLHEGWGVNASLDDSTHA